MNSEIININFSNEELKILEMFKFINKELGNKIYKLDSKTLFFLSSFFKKKDMAILNSLWTENSLQKDAFLFCLEIFKYKEKNIHLDRGKLMNSLEKKFYSPILKPILSSLIGDIHYFLQDKVYEEDITNIPLYRDNNFEIYYLKNRNSIFIGNLFSWGDLFFHVFSDGLVLFKEQVLGEQDLLFTNKSFHLDDFKLITSNYSEILFVIKENYLNYNNLSIPNIDYKVAQLFHSKMLQETIRKNIIEEKNHFSLLQITNYLVERIKIDVIESPNIEYINYKQQILDFFSDDSILFEENIIILLLEKLNVSLSLLYKIFDELFKMTPHKYIENLKLEKSYLLLCQSDETIESIAETLGFTRKIFSQKFIAKVGYTPNQFRSLIKGVT